MTIMAQSALARTMRRAIMHALADEERADLVLESIQIGDASMENTPVS